MRKNTWIIVVVIILILLVGTTFLLRDGTATTPTPVVEHELILVHTPLSGQEVSSPLVVRGEARGNWYFEASFPVRLLDASGRELAVAVAQAGGEWMTTEFVPFETRLTFISPSPQTGTLVLQKDNPSGLPENDDELRIPVRLGSNTVETRIIKLFYYNESKDQDPSGNILCSSKGLEAVDRQITRTITPIQDSIKLLLEGDVTFSEQSRGIDTEFPLSGVSLESASLANGVLTLQFDDPENRTGGGSCRVNILRAQIEATAKQFPEVRQVRIIPEDLFQP